MSTDRFEMRYPTDLLQKIDDWRERQTVPPSRAAAIRHLIERALATEAPARTALASKARHG